MARVSRASVTVTRDDGSRHVTGAIGEGLLVLLGVHRDDTGGSGADTMARKLHELRLLRPGDGGVERSCADAGAPLLVVSQFTLYGDTRKGRRPSSTPWWPACATAAPPSRPASSAR